ncbi:hypothetical protein ACSTID_24165, partial [Vibrio parahaemolyticus]
RADRSAERWQARCDRAGAREGRAGPGRRHATEGIAAQRLEGRAVVAVQREGARRLRQPISSPSAESWCV